MYYLSMCLVCDDLHDACAEVVLEADVELLPQVDLIDPALVPRHRLPHLHTAQHLQVQQVEQLLPADILCRYYYYMCYISNLLK